MTPALSGASQHLYTVFRRYRSVSFEGCPDCTSPAETARLAAPPLRELNPDDLARYAFKAMTTWGTVDDFKHFLPRIFDLLAQTGGGSWIEPEIVFGKLPYGKWTTWPRRERDALLAYMDALWNDTLARYPHPFEADSCLCGIGQAVDDLSPYLSAWSRSSELPALRHFVEFAHWNIPDRKHKSLTNAFWRERPDQAAQVETWLISPARDDWLTAAMLRFGADDAVAAELAEAMTSVEIIRAGYAGTP